MTSTKPAPDLWLAVNLVRRWGEVASGTSTSAEVTLGDWAPWVGVSTTRMYFDPDRIAVIVGCVRGKTVSVFDVVPDASGARWRWVGDDSRQRIRFHGRPSERFAAQLRAPAPTWSQGQGTPFKTFPLTELLQGEGPVDSSTRHAVLGEAVVTTDGPRHITVSVPAGYEVTVRTRTADAASPIADRSS